MAKALLSFVVPCYRSAETIGSVVAEIEETVTARAAEYDHAFTNVVYLRIVGHGRVHMDTDHNPQVFFQFPLRTVDHLVHRHNIARRADLSMGCTIQTRNGPKRVCKDGPVFGREEIEWQTQA